MPSDILAELVRQARAALAAAGLERRTLGEDVYWSGGAEDAPPLVLVHGANDQAATWAAVVPSLIGRFRLLLVDLPAHGESGPRTGPVRVPYVVERLASVLDRDLGDRPCTLVGNSLGSWIVMLYALEHPDRVERLILESGGGLARPLGAPLLPATPEEARLTLRAVHGPDAPISDWAIDALLQRGASSPVMQILETDWLEHFVDARLADIHAPTTIIRGEHDTMVPHEYAEALRAGIPGAQTVTIPDAAHIPHAQQPEAFVRCLTAIF